MGSSFLLRINQMNESQIIEMLKSESVGMAIRYALRNPSKAGIDECKDSGSLYDLYEYIKQLNK